MQIEAAKMTQDEKPTSGLARLESAIPVKGMRYVFVDKELEKRVMRMLGW